MTKKTIKSLQSGQKLVFKPGNKRAGSTVTFLARIPNRSQSMFLIRGYDGVETIVPADHFAVSHLDHSRQRRCNRIGRRPAN